MKSKKGTRKSNRWKREQGVNRQLGIRREQKESLMKKTLQRATQPEIEKGKRARREKAREGKEIKILRRKRERGMVQYGDCSVPQSLVFLFVVNPGFIGFRHKLNLDEFPNLIINWNKWTV